MKLVKSFFLMLSMFTRIPTPKVEWSEGNMRYAMGVFPLAGALIGLLLLLWFWLCDTLELGTILFAAGVTLVPVAVTGGIHLDGLCDTADALSSHASPERKREIMKDPHAGAFAIITLGAYLLFYFALASELKNETATVYALGLIHMLSRVSSGIAVLYYPAASNTGLLVAFRGAATRRVSGALLILILAACAFAFAMLSFKSGLFVVLAGLLCAGFVFRLANKQFGGVNGDVTGFLLQLSELCMLTAYVVSQKAVAL